MKDILSLVTLKKLQNIEKLTSTRILQEISNFHSARTVKLKVKCNILKQLEMVSLRKFNQEL